MTADQFRAALVEAGLTQAEFARSLSAYEAVKPASVARRVRAWATGRARVPPAIAWGLGRRQVIDMPCPPPQGRDEAVRRIVQPIVDELVAAVVAHLVDKYRKIGR